MRPTLCTFIFVAVLAADLRASALEAVRPAARTQESPSAPEALAQESPAASEAPAQESPAAPEARVAEPPVASEPPVRAEPATVNLDGKGLRIASADGAYGLALHGLIQADGRIFVNDEHKLTDTLLLRRVRPTLELVAAKIVTARLMPDFGGGQAVLYDAYIDVAPLAELRFRVGKMKVPFGLERWQYDHALYFPERGYPSALAPTRDVGGYVYGEPFGGAIGYALGVFNGVADGALGDLDTDDNKEGVAWLYTKPAKGLLVGVAGTLGEKNGTPANTQLSPYRTVGQNTFFSYRADTTAGAPAANTTVAAGVHDRLTTHISWTLGPVGVLGEFALTQQRVARAAASRLLEHHAWSATLAWVVTGEDASFDDVSVKRPLDPKAGDFGALEIVARYGELRFDRTSFQDFAQDDKSARLAREVGGGFNWYPASPLKVAADYFVTEFRAGQPPIGNHRDVEQVVLLRTQFFL
jgi:phosphate-selective porin OprO/OprP